MRWWKYILILFVAFGDFSPLSAQSQNATSTDAILMIPEPNITKGSSNRVFSENLFGVKTFLFKLDTATEWDTIASSGNPNQYFEDIGGLQNGLTYQFSVLFGGDLSNIVSSTQDNQPPVVTIELGGNFVNLNTFTIPFSAYDLISQSVKEAVLYYRPFHNEDLPWRLVSSKSLDSSEVAIESDPLNDNMIFIVPDSLGDGAYEFYIAARDTAWAPEHRPDEVFTGVDGNIFLPLDNIPALKQIFVDSRQPVSSITSQLNNIINDANLSIEFTAKDSAIGHHGYLGSGISKASLYMNYKENLAGPFIFQDSLISRQSYITPLLSVTGDVNFTVNNDGYYEFYTLTSDTAQNRENNGLPKTTTIPFVFVDTNPPQMDSLVTVDSFPDNLHPAKPGWTKSSVINFSAYGIADLEKDGYLSDVDSLFLAENANFDVNRNAFIASTGVISGEYNLEETSESKTVFAKVTDKAGNASEVVSKTITYDPQAPVIVNFDIPVSITTKRNLTVTVSAEDNFILDSLSLWLNNSLLSSIYLPEDGQYNADIPFTLPETYDWHYLSAQVRDKAGNISTIAQDSVRLSNTVVLSDLQLNDWSSATNPYLQADVGYTDSSDIAAFVTYQGELLKVQLSEDPTFTTVDDYVPPWNIVSQTGGDTTIQMNYRLSNNDGDKTIYMRGFGPQLTDTSNVLAGNMFLDTVEPVLNEVIVYHVLGANDTTISYTQSRNVGVKIKTPDNNLSKIVLWESGQDSVLYQTFSSDTTYTLKSPDDGLILFNVGIRDRAGNWSSIIQTDVFLDRRLPILQSISFNNVYASSFQVNINLAARDDTLFSGIGALDYVRFSENEDFPANETQSFDLPDGITFNGNLPINLKPEYGSHVVYGQVRDKAGNWSGVLNAEITVVQIVQPTNITLMDSTPSSQVENAAFPGWSNSDTVKVQLSYSGVLKQIVTAKDPAFTSGVQAFNTWTTVNDSTVFVNYDFADVQGNAELWVKLVGPNLTDTSAVISGSIRIDKESPQLTNIDLFQVQTAGDTLFEFSNNKTIEIGFASPSEPLTYALIREAGSASQLFVVNSSSIPYTFLSATNELKTIVATVRDSAGNWSSQEYMDSMTLDTQIPSLSGLILSDITKPGIVDSALTDDLELEVTFQSSDVDPGKLFRLIIAQDQSVTSNRQVFVFNTNQIEFSNGTFTAFYMVNKAVVINNNITCWAVVEDSALNQSSVFFEEITLTEKLLVQANLFDRDDPSDSLFSDSQTVRLEIREASGVFEEIAFAESIGDLTEWVPVTTGETFTTDYTFGSASDYFGAKLYVSARNSADQIVVDSTTIFIDQVFPVVNSVNVIATTPPGELEYSNSQRVKLQLSINDTGELQEIQISEDSLFTAYETMTIQSTPFTGEVDFDLSANNGVKRIFVRAVDAAENTGASTVGSIIADYDPASSVTNHPNPFNPAQEPTTIIVKTSGLQAFEANIYDLFGNHVRKIMVPSGERYNQVLWDGFNGKGEMVANGGYICVIETDSKIITRKIAVRK